MNLKHLLVSLSVVASAAATLSSQDFKEPDADTWYRIVTLYNGDDARAGRCVQYFPEGSVHSGLIWSAEQLADTDPDADYQYWRFEPSPDGSGRYAIVCKAAPGGYLSDDPTSFDAGGRWRYVVDVAAGAENDDKYGFEFGAIKAGVDESTGEGYSDIYTDYASSQLFRYLNCAGASEDYAINVGRATSPDDSNEWLFRLSPKKQVSGVEKIAMETSEATDGAPEIYDLYGRRVAPPAHGLYIINGKKVVL